MLPGYLYCTHADSQSVFWNFRGHLRKRTPAVGKTRYLSRLETHRTIQLFGPFRMNVHCFHACRYTYLHLGIKDAERGWTGT
jgi:hypothetical protein